jgi:hypothetical protein
LKKCRTRRNSLAPFLLRHRGTHVGGSFAWRFE